jgi:cysteine-rich repeat protein
MGGAIARRPDVVNVEPWIEPKLFGERQGQIVADQVNAAGTEPVAPGYLAWLNSLGFNSNLAFSVNVSDSGLDRGQITAGNIHPDFRDAGGNSRVAYVQKVTGTTIDTTAAGNIDTDGHGTINAAIVGGFNNGTGSAFEDGDGYQFGLGIAPFVLLGSSRIFAPNFTNPDHKELTNAAYLKGARVSSNSWGSSCSPRGCCPPGVLGDYTADSQEFDALTRDARPSSASDGGDSGNQEILIVFSAGNQGGCQHEDLGNNGSTAKNTLVVGAGENFNQAGTDGCGIGNSGANNAHDVISFSSRGPTVDDRIKPDLMAPGTHIYGAASQHPSYDGSGVCDQFHPAGQTLYAWSSGTSHSTPAVAGSAALVRQWFLDHGSPAPSPAMIKAYLMNAPTRMTGVGANDTLPSNTQGMGRMNLERSFDSAARILVDQTNLLDATGETFQVTGTIQDSLLPFRVTLAWTDQPGPTVGNAWVNDLDLEVEVDGGGGPVLYRGNNFTGEVSQTGGTADFMNNVESVWLAAGTTGSFTVTVRAQNIAGDGVPNVGDAFDQDFALVVYNGASEVCGDGVITGSEACDDNNTNPGDGCDASCQIELGWTCTGEPSVCELCGNGLIEGGEACDDFNTSPGDGCSATCQVEAGWTCDGEPSVCQLCGNGSIEGTEECDDFNTVGGDCCAADCTFETVGSSCDDGLFCNVGEACDGAGNCGGGAARNCGDGVGCTVDSCDETGDTCVNTPDDATCDDAQFCNGAETCDAILDCQAGTTVGCDDGVGCTVDACNEGTDSCDSSATAPRPATPSWTARLERWWTATMPTSAPMIRAMKIPTRATTSSTRPTIRSVFRRSVEMV